MATTMILSQEARNIYPCQPPARERLWGGFGRCYVEDANGGSGRYDEGDVQSDDGSAARPYRGGVRPSFDPVIGVVVRAQL